MDTLVHNTSSQQFTLTDTQGDVITFNDFSSTLPTNQQGTFASYTDPDGNTIGVTSYTTDGKLAEIQRTVTASGSTTITESYLFSYIASGTNAGLMSSVVLRRQRRQRFVDHGAAGGLHLLQRHRSPTATLGDLKLAVVEDGSGNVLDTSYYRYYTGESSGYHAWPEVRLQPRVLRPADGGPGHQPVVADRCASGALCRQLLPVRLRQPRHRGDRRRRRRFRRHRPGLGTFTYSYTASSNTPGFNSWATKTVETLPDGNQNIVYTNDGRRGDALRLRGHRQQLAVGHLLRVRCAGPGHPGGAAVGGHRLQRQLCRPAAQRQRQLRSTSTTAAA